MDTSKGGKTRLDSRGSIARYLGLRSRTVHAWHSRYGLPVRRAGSGSSSFFANADEFERCLSECLPNGSDGEEVLLGAVLAELEACSFSSSFTPDSRTQLPSMSRPVAGLLSREERMWKTLSESNPSGIKRIHRRLIDLKPSCAKEFVGLARADA